MADIQKLLTFAREAGFSAAAVMETKDLVIVPEWRKYCEQNRCGRYGVNPSCPPACGTVEEMTARLTRFDRALVLQSTVNPEEMKVNGVKFDLNEKSEALLLRLPEIGITESDMITAGPYKQWSCVSAYCIDAQKMADKVGMLCWAHDGLNRFFTLILYNG